MMNNLKQENICSCKRCQVSPPNPFCCDQHMIQGGVLYTSCDFKRRNGLDCRALRTAPSETAAEDKGHINQAHICRECTASVNQKQQFNGLGQESAIHHCKHSNQRDVQKCDPIKEQMKRVSKEEAFSPISQKIQNQKNCQEHSDIRNQPRSQLPIRCNGLSRSFSSHPSMEPNQKDPQTNFQERENILNTCPVCHLNKPSKNTLLQRDIHSTQSESAPKLCVSSGHKQPNLRDQQNISTNIDKPIISCSNCYVIDTQNIVQAPKNDCQIGTDFTSKSTTGSKVYQCKAHHNFPGNMKGFESSNCNHN